jgi:hypothetical protein
MKKILLTTCVFATALSLSAQTYFSEDFEGATAPALPAGATSVDTDADGFEWSVYTPSTQDPWTANGNVAASSSYDNAAGALTPDNLLILGPIDLSSSAGSTVALQWDAGATEATSTGWYEENYSVYVETGMTPGSAVFTETLAAGQTLFSHSVDVSSHAGAGAVYVIFRHHACTDEWVLGIDNVTLKTLLPNDVTMTSISTPTTAATASNVSIAGTVTNSGSATITSLDVLWDDGGTPNSHTFTGISIPSGGTYNFTHPTQLTVGSTHSLNICAQITGVTDGNPGDNCLSHTVSGLAFVPVRSVLTEEGTGTWCGYCPRGAVAMETMYNDATRPNFVGIAVHNGDPMAVAAYDSEMNLGGYPSGNTNRYILDHSVGINFNGQYDAEILRPTTAEVSVSGTYDPSGNISVDVTGTFAAILATEHRFAAILVEDGVTGGSGYEQSNYYDGGGSGPLSGGGIADWTTAGNPVPAANMVYDHVGRELLGGFAGQAGSISTPTTAGGTQTYTFTSSVGSYTGSNLKVVGLIIETATGEIVNVAESPLAFTGINENDFVSEFNIYPNPANSSTNIEFALTESADVTVSIVNMMGQTVYNETASSVSGTQKISVNAANMANGMYFVNLNVNGKIVTKRLSIAK